MPEEQYQDIVLEPPAPHSKKQRLLYQAFMMPDVMEIFAAAGTKFGKTMGLACGMSSAGLSRQRAVWRWSAPIYEQAEIGMDYCTRILPNDPKIVDVNRSRMEIAFPDLDSKIKFRHTQHPTSLEGVGIAGDLFDECAKIKREAYDAARTTRTVTKGLFVGASTPLGKNWFYVKCMDAKDRMEWAMKNGKPVTHIFLHAPSTDNPMVSKEAIAEARRDMPDRLFRQYYLAEFVDDGTVFSGFRDCIFGDELAVYGEHQSWFEEGHEEKQVVLCADWAKTIDWTVFGAFDVNARPHRLIGFMRFHKKKYTEAVHKLGLFGKKFGEVLGGLHDKTGVGVAIDELVVELPFPMTGVTFNNKSKTEMVNRAINKTELKDVAIPNWPQLIRELDAYEVHTNAIGQMSYSAPSGQHDDCVTMLFLGISALNEFSGGEVTILGDKPEPKKDAEGKVIPEPPRELSAIEQFYQDLAEDDD